MPAYVQPSFNIPAPSTAITPPSAAPLETRRGRAACETNYASLSPAERQRCPPPPPAQIDDAMRLLNPPSHVKDEAYWAEEKTRSDGPLPGTSFDTHSTHITLFKSDGPSILGGYRTPDAAPTHAHSSDADFQKALAATQARTRALYGRAPDATNKRAAP
jgi:hypothetical protein